MVCLLTRRLPQPAMPSPVVTCIYIYSKAQRSENYLQRSRMQRSQIVFRPERTAGTTTVAPNSTDTWTPRRLATAAQCGPAQPTRYHAAKKNSLMPFAMPLKRRSGGGGIYIGFHGGGFVASRLASCFLRCVKKDCPDGMRCAMLLPGHGQWLSRPMLQADSTLDAPCATAPLRNRVALDLVVY